MESPTVVDLFSGGGGFARGFSEAGFNIALAIDNDEACGKTYKLNFSRAAVLVEDIRDVSGRDIQHILGFKPDVVIGSPPCEPFTGANPNREPNPLDRLYRDPLGILTLEFVRIVGEIKPKIFVMENVPPLADGALRSAVKREFEYVGYSRVFFNILRAEDFGTPSRRTRLFISNVIMNPTPLNERMTVEDALKDLPPPETSYVPNHEVVPISERRLKKIARIKVGKAMYYYQGASRRLPNFVRLNPNDIAPTVLGSSRFIHPYEDRLLTVREQARLMGYPDDHLFVGGREQQYNQVGESVPPPLSRAIAEYLLKLYFL
ncbi:MAG: DNA cytosine methyltransferase [Ignisphaera sp.]|nr:DNA cytosine methyltransferase [Ignisphaera sp.]MCX8168565.1 DNA cytosine methyltransferase [Ignisphaera sp.]MDW8085151.1 DNA cytosine methyltransferase [Ignisphaera sp.]